MTLSSYFALNPVLASVCLGPETANFENNFVKTNKDSHLLCVSTALLYFCILLYSASNDCKCVLINSVQIQYSHVITSILSAAPIVSRDSSF